MRYPSWDTFKVNYAETKEKTLEALARILFKKRYGLKESLPYFKNHAGNETDVITYNGEIIGFQAKYFDGTISATQIIHSLEEAREWNAKQTKVVLYTNKEFGNPKKKNQNDDTANKTTAQINIENKAKELHLELEWMYGDNILDAVAECDLAYDLFFNPNVDLIHLDDHVKKANDLYLRNVKTQIILKDQTIKVDRSEKYHQLTEWLSEGKHVIVTGEGGSGKSAIVKMYYEEHRDDTPMICMNAGQLNSDDVNTLFHLEKSYDLGLVREFYESNSHKVLLIDSAEKLLEVNNKMPLMLLVDSLQEDGWSIVFTVRNSSLGGLQDLIQNFLRLDTEILPIERLNSFELDKLLAANHLERPSDENLYDRIHNLFYLARFAELAFGGDLSYHQYRDQVWNQKIRGDQAYALQMQEAREQCLLEIVKRQWQTGNYYVGKEDLDYSAISSLMQDEILGSDNRYGYYLIHDLYADWASDYIVSRMVYNYHNKPKEFLSTLGDENTAINAFRRWIIERLDSEDNDATPFIDAVMKGEIEEKWIEPIISAVLRSNNYSSTYFKQYGAQLTDDDFNWFNKVLHILLTSCQNIHSYITYQRKQYPVMRPVGSGWEATINYLFWHYTEYRVKHGHLVAKLLTDYATKKDRLMDSEVQAGMMAMRPIHENAENRKEGKSDWFFNEKDTCKLACMYPTPLSLDLKKIIPEVITNNWVHHGDPYYELMTYLVDAKDTNAMVTLCYLIPDEIMRLLDTFWSEVEENEEDDESHRPIPIPRYKEAEEVWGLNTHLLTMHNYFPPGAQQTCLGILLRLHREKTMEFIIHFMNKAIKNYSESEWRNPEIRETTLTLKDGKIKNIVGNQYTWNMYRGSGGNEPYLLQSIHMALENYLLKASEDKKFSDVKHCLDDMLEKSDCNSLTAIVASIVTAFPNEYFEEALQVCSSLQCLKWDLTRYSHEIAISTIDFAYREYPEMLEERKKSNAMAHRKQHLETLLLSMQLSWTDTTNDEVKKKLERVCELVDRLKNQLDTEPENEKLTAKFIISRLDLRSMKAEEVEVGGIKGIQYTPALDEEQKAVQSRPDFPSKNIFSGFALRKWSEMRLNEQYDKAKDSEYDQNPQKAIDDCKLVMKELEENPEAKVLTFGDEFVPSLVGAVMIRDYKAQISKEDYEFCFNNVIEALENLQFMLSSGVSSFRLIMSVLGTMLDQKPEYTERYKRILTSYSDIGYETGGNHCCMIVAAAVFCCELWKNHRAFMTDVIDSFVKEHQDGRIETFSIEEAESLLCMISVDSEDDRIRVYAKTCLEKISRVWNEKDNGLNMYSSHQYIMADVIARYVMSLPSDLIPENVAYLARYVNKNQHDNMLMPFVIRASLYGEYRGFWDVWEAFYDTLINKTQYYYDCELLNNYMLNPVMYTDWGDDWFRFEEKGMAFYNRIAHDIGRNPTVIKVVAKNCGTIARHYYMQAIPILAYIINEHPSLQLKDNNLIVLNYLERMMRRLMKEHSKEIKTNRTLKGQVITILDFMIKHENPFAGEMKKGL